jgi:hypothetical protein
MGSTNSGPQLGIFAHTMPGWCNLEDRSLILNHPYHEYGYAILSRARGSLLVAPPYPEGCFIVHLRHSRPTWTTHHCNKAEPSVLGEVVTTTRPLPGIAYNAITPTYHINLLHERQDSACKISKQIRSTNIRLVLHVSGA